jgi:predicted nucleic acid-binding protein
MTSTAVRTHCIDASALVKYYVNEPGSDVLREYLRGQANWYTTPFCLFEALSVLKSNGVWVSDHETNILDVVVGLCPVLHKL